MYPLSVCFGLALFLPIVIGWSRNCGIEHCMNCEHGHCTECEYGYHGYACDKKCQGCWHGGCEKDSGRCNMCSPGHFTDSCQTPCPTSCRVSYDGHRYCNRTTGYCLEGCEASHWGPQCQWNCNSNCRGKLSCGQSDGSCLEGCIDGWFGLACDKPCPPNCLQDRCSLILGQCSDGCNRGFTGLKCDMNCENCIGEECSYNDLDESLTCTKGCKDGWTSANCKQRCSSTCLHGKCQSNGTCHTCQDGYYDDKCLKRCPQTCTACNKSTRQSCIVIVTTIPSPVSNTISGSAKLTSVLYLVLTVLGLQLI